MRRGVLGGCALVEFHFAFAYRDLLLTVIQHRSEFNVVRLS